MSGSSSTIWRMRKPEGCSAQVQRIFSISPCPHGPVVQNRLNHVQLHVCTVHSDSIRKHELISPASGSWRTLLCLDVLSDIVMSTGCWWTRPDLFLLSPSDPVSPADVSGSDPQSCSHPAPSQPAPPCQSSSALQGAPPPLPPPPQLGPSAQNPFQVPGPGLGPSLPPPYKISPDELNKEDVIFFWSCFRGERQKLCFYSCF